MNQAFLRKLPIPENYTVVSLYYNPYYDNYDPYDYPRRYYRRRPYGGSGGPWQNILLIAVLAAGVLAGSKIGEWKAAYNNWVHEDNPAQKGKYNKDKYSPGDASGQNQNVAVDPKPVKVPILRICDSGRGGREYFRGREVQMTGFVKQVSKQDMSITWLLLEDKGCQIWAAFETFHGENMPETGAYITVVGRLEEVETIGNFRLESSRIVEDREG
jgi:hypothetical protein